MVKNMRAKCRTQDSGCKINLLEYLEAGRLGTGAASSRLKVENYLLSQYKNRTITGFIQVVANIAEVLLGFIALIDLRSLLCLSIPIAIGDKQHILRKLKSECERTCALPF